MSRKKSKRAEKSDTQPFMGVGWYRPDQWQRLREVSADREKLHDTWAEWYVHATSTVLDLQSMGIRLSKVEVDVEELIRWCEKRGEPVNSGSRSKFIAAKTGELHGCDESEGSDTREQSAD